MNTDDQRSAIEKMLKDQGKSPSTMEITGTAGAYCNTVSKPYSKISDINRG